jgi:hypothetical protein
MKKAKLGDGGEVPAVSSWREEVSAAIENGDAGDVKEIEVQLLALVSAAQHRLKGLKDRTTCTNGTCMVLIDSNEYQDQDVSCNMCSRSVSAKFTVGPNRHPFDMSFDNENEDGEETIKIDGPCFEFRSGIKNPVVFHDDKIEAFLIAAGLEAAQPARAPNYSCSMTAQERWRWLLGDVIHDAVALVCGEHGYEDNCGVSLGMGQEDVYGWLGLQY